MLLEGVGALARSWGAAWCAGTCGYGMDGGAAGVGAQLGGKAQAMGYNKFCPAPRVGRVVACLLCGCCVAAAWLPRGGA